MVELKRDLQLYAQDMYRYVNGKIKNKSLYKKGSIGLIIAVDSNHNDDISIRMLRSDGGGLIKRNKENHQSVQRIQHDFKIISMASGRGTM